MAQVNKLPVHVCACAVSHLLVFSAAIATAVNPRQSGLIGGRSPGLSGLVKQKVALIKKLRFIDMSRGDEHK
jgi:hypothetical protein